MNLTRRLDIRLEDILVEARPTEIINHIHKISQLFEKTVRIRTLADGAVGLFRAADGQAYEVQIRPAQYAQHIKTSKPSKPSTAAGKELQ